ncbi:ribonuclease H-like domain-containing protein [Tanacetum coccineum]
MRRLNQVFVSCGWCNGIIMAVIFRTNRLIPSSSGYNPLQYIVPALELHIYTYILLEDHTGNTKCNPDLRTAKKPRGLGLFQQSYGCTEVGWLIYAVAGGVSPFAENMEKRLSSESKKNIKKARVPNILPFEEGELPVRYDETASTEFINLRCEVILARKLDIGIRRLIANGHNQQYGVDCSDTFSPVVKPATIRTVLSLALARNWHVHQHDVKNAFLNGDLSETVYMYHPPGFVDSRFPHHVYRLQRSLYGLKLAPRAWFQRFTGYALRVGFTSSRCDSSLFIYQHGTKVEYLLIYVDDW